MTKLINYEPRGKGFDPEIVPVLRELNNKGYKTYGSCAGHGKKYDGGSGFNRGSIDIMYTPEKYKFGRFEKTKKMHIKDVNNVINILKKYGLRWIHFDQPGSFSFTSIGKIEK